MMRVMTPPGALHRVSKVMPVCEVRAIGHLLFHQSYGGKHTISCIRCQESGHLIVRLPEKAIAVVVIR